MTEQSHSRETNAGSRQRSSSGSRDGQASGKKRGPSRATILREARTQLEELTGMTSESISAFRSTDDGWQLNVEVVELTRIPDTTSILATYSVQLDQHGDLVSYERVSRYSRGQIGR